MQTCLEQPIVIPWRSLQQGDRTRLPNLIPVRYQRMLASPFAFLRGAAAVMAQDLRYQPSAGIAVHACGDCHLMNFGAFATPEENILFDIDDFDETLPGVDFTVDLKRLAASVAVAALAEGFSKKRARATAAATVEAFRTRMRALAKLSPMEIWHSRIDLAREVKYIEDRSLRRKLHAILSKAGKRLEQDDNFPHMVTGGQGRIADKPPVIYHLTQKGDVKHRINAERMFASYQTRLPPERLRLYERYARKTLPSRPSGSEAPGRSVPWAYLSAPTAILFSCKSKRPENPSSNVLDPSSVVIRADGLSKDNMLCRHRATYFSVGRKTPHRNDISMCVN